MPRASAVSTVPPTTITKEDDASVSCSTLSKADSSSGKVSSMMRKVGGKLLILRKRNDGSTQLTLSANSHLDESEVDSLYETLDDSNATRDDDGLMLDKFGFVIEMEDISEEQSLANSTKNEDDRLLKMHQMLAKVPDTAAGDVGPTTSTMKNFARKGFPDTMRRQAWTTIAGVEKMMKEREGMYSNLVQGFDAEQEDDSKSNRLKPVFKAIDKDILRTFPKHHLFRQENTTSSCRLQGDDKEDNQVEIVEGEGCAKLRRVLRAYSQYDSEVGYCQGMNFIAAMFLMFLSEEEAFWLLVVVMNEEPYKLRDLFGQNMSGTLEVLYIAEKLMIQFLPKLDDHFGNEQVHISIFATQWLMTVYASTFSFDLVVRVWDSFLTEGWKVVYRVMLAMLKQNQEVLLSKGIEGIIPYLLREFPSTVNADSIMSLSQRIPLKTRHIQKYAEDFRKMIENNEIEAQEILHRGVSGERSLDGDASVASSSIVSKRLPVLRFVKKLTSARREVQTEDLSEKLGRFAVLIHNVLSPEECRELVRRAKGENFQEILVRGAGKYHADVASCDRCVVKDADLAAELFNRVAYALQGSGLDKNLQHASGNATMCATGLSNQLHFLKFRQGDFFAPHRDSQYKRGHETSYVTLQVYLNSSYRGGITSFNGSGGKHFDLKAKTGTILLFSQDLRRQETAVTEGRRFTIRADIMYGSHH